jgi:hypothetical protein
MPYLLEKAQPGSTWTIITGAAGDRGYGGVTAIGQGALYGLINVAIRESGSTGASEPSAHSVRVNEIYLAGSVAYDTDAASQPGAMPSSEFGLVYQGILANEKIRGARVTVTGPADLKELKWTAKLPQ